MSRGRVPPLVPLNEALITFTKPPHNQYHLNAGGTRITCVEHSCKEGMVSETLMSIKISRPPMYVKDLIFGEVQNSSFLIADQLLIEIDRDSDPEHCPTPKPDDAPVPVTSDNKALLA